MKEIKRHQSKYYSVTALDKEDYKKIIDVFQNDIANCTITIGRYHIPDATYLDAAEAKTEKKTIEDFSILLHQRPPETATSRTLSVEINQGAAHIYLSDDTDNYLLGLASQLDKILAEKRAVKREGMKEVKQSKYISYSFVPLYREDIEKIIDVFQNDIADCTITIDRYEIPDVTHLDEVQARTNGKKIKDFTIRLYQRFLETDTFRTLTVDIERFGARVHISDDTDNYLLGLASKLDGIFRAKKSIGGILSNPKVGGTLMFILIGTFTILSATLPWKFSDHSIQSTTLMIITFIPLLLACIEISFVLTRHLKGKVISLEYSHNRTNFLKRNKDQIIFALTFGTIGVVLGAILTAIILHAIYPPKP